MRKDTLKEIENALNAEKTRSAWSRGVKAYALEIWETVSEAIRGGYAEFDDLKSPRMREKLYLYGAPSWEDASWGGCFLICDSSIAERLCNPSELKKTRNGERRLNGREEWLDTQARALHQAARMLDRVIAATI